MSDPPDSYETLDASATAEIKVKRSRFLAEAAPAADERTARSVIGATARRYHDSRHVCYAWRLGYGERVVEIRNDAGEPSGSAGQPILTAIRRTGLSDCVVVVARYFGGVKLGTGGLGRAYGEVAAMALAQAARRTVALGRTFTLTFGYPQQKKVAKLLAAHQGRILSETYLTEINWQLWLRPPKWRRFSAALGEATAGALTLTDK